MREKAIWSTLQWHLRSAGGGFYIQGKFITPALGVATDTIIPETVISDLDYEDVKPLIGNPTYTTMVFVKTAGGAEIYPVSVKLIQGDYDEVIISVKFVQKTSVSFGIGTFYCRINE